MTLLILSVLFLIAYGIVFYIGLKCIDKFMDMQDKKRETIEHSLELLTIELRNNRIKDYIISEAREKNLAIVSAIIAQQLENYLALNYNFDRTKLMTPAEEKETIKIVTSNVLNTLSANTFEILCLIIDKDKVIEFITTEISLKLTKKNRFK